MGVKTLKGHLLTRRGTKDKTYSYNLGWKNVWNNYLEVF